MSNVDMIKHYVVQLEKYSNQDIIRINNYVESNHKNQKLIWPYEERVMKRIVEWDKHYSVLESIEKFNEKYDTDLSYGLPIKGIDKDAVVVVYKNTTKILGFWFCPYGIDQDKDNIIDSIAVELTGCLKEDLQQLNDDLGLNERPLAWYDSNIINEEDDEDE